MRILAVSDRESPYYWDFFEKSKLEGIDLILSCGDLDPHYLSFLCTFTSAPVLYVHGNHDGKYDTVPPDGCISVEDRIYTFRNIRILGLGGSMKYCDDKKYQYSEKEMRRRVRKLKLQLLMRKGFDILLTHSPALGLNDGEDLPHRGFGVFTELLEKYEPRFLLHGHVHLNYGQRVKRYLKHGNTHIINAYERVVFDFEAEEPGLMLR